MIQTDPSFLGVVPRGARSYVAREIVRLDKPLFNACAGRFSVVEAAVKTGFPAAKVHASDIGLFSSLIGYLADDSKRLDHLGIRILDPDLEPRDVRDELDFAAQVMLILKLNQLSQTNLRGLYLREELRANWSRYRQSIREDLAGPVTAIKGIHYELADIWDIAERVRVEDVSFFASVPHYARGYETMIEAMACGTPTIAFNCGSVPEVITHGVTGLIVDSMLEAVSAVEEASTLDRTVCRQEFERRFTASRMAREYLNLYQAILSARSLSPEPCEIDSMLTN